MASKGSKSKAIRLPINLMFFILLASIPSSAAEQTACSGNFMELEECVDVFRALTRQRTPSKNFCCSLIGNMVQLEAMGTCLCTALEDIVLDVIKRETPSASLCLLWNYCESEIPPDFQCINVPSHGSM